MADNVSGMLANRNSAAVNNILWMFDEAGYHVTVKLVNAKNYVVARKEKEFFIYVSEKI